MTITASMVKELREKSGAGMMDCKNALKENDGDLEAAMDWLRTKGITKAEKKSGRVAAEGLVGILSDGNKAAVVEVNSETDFVARNEQFQSIVRGVAASAIGTDGSLEAVASAAISVDGSDTGKSVSETITEAIGTIGENMNLRRIAVMAVPEGVVASYVHNAISDGLGKIGVLVALESSGKTEVLTAIGRQIAMHIAALNPLAATQDDIPQDVADRERAIFSEQARESGKPDNIVEKMVDGRMRKFYQESVLLSQTFVVDGENTVEQALKNVEGDAGATITLRGFTRFALGDGIEKEESDFAAEVAEMNKS
ncbi:MAG: elongation factor Ts [Hyphomicrobiales bacterium]|nr:elongation factor Ts [Hyphomicrobiales bacterium]